MKNNIQWDASLNLVNSLLFVYLLYIFFYDLYTCMYVCIMIVFFNVIYHNFPLCMNLQNSFVTNLLVYLFIYSHFFCIFFFLLFTYYLIFFWFIFFFFSLFYVYDKINKHTIYFSSTMFSNLFIFFVNKAKQNNKKYRNLIFFFPKTHRSAKINHVWTVQLLIHV